MEKTPTFALPNEFLIWVAAKFLANCDLNLLLTEYYIEALGSQLKNGETQTHAHLKSARSTYISRPNLPSDSKTCNKPSDLRPDSYTLLTPPSSPIPAPLSIPSSPSFDCPCLLSHSPLFLFSYPQTSRPSTVQLVQWLAQVLHQRLQTLIPQKKVCLRPFRCILMQSCLTPVLLELLFLKTQASPTFSNDIAECVSIIKSTNERKLSGSHDTEIFRGKYVETLISSSGTTWVTI